MGSVKLVEFRSLILSYNCEIVKTAKEWKILDRSDGKRISSFATVSGREVKPIYVKHFLKAINKKRGIT